MLVVGLALFSQTAAAQSTEEVSTLRQELAAQADLIRKQIALIEGQEQAIASLKAQLEEVNRRLAELESSDTASSGPASEIPAKEQAGSSAAQMPDQRDSVGDLNSDSVAAGDFPGSIRIPGTQGVSMAFGGFVKAVAIADSDAEALGADMLPGNLGTKRDDTGGNFAIDSTITRLFVDARAPTPSDGKLRAYIEYDLNNSNDGSLGFKLRHAYGSFQTGVGTLTAGHTWSTAMDLRILPEGLTEPTISGVVFQRQAQLRWSWPQGKGFTAHVAVEDPSGTDVFTNEALDTRSSLPDFIGAVEFDRPRTHLRFGTLVRRLEVKNDETDFTSTAVGWGLAGTGRFPVFDSDAFAFSVVYGSGAGRYMLGLGSGSGAFLEPGETNLRLRRNAGGMAWYRHSWTPALRSTWGYGHTRSELFASHPGSELYSTTYAYGNLMRSLMRYATVGFEYDFGRRTNKDGTVKDNHRIMFGIQIF